MAIELTEEQKATWIAKSQAFINARKWSVEGASEDEIKAGNAKLNEYRAAKMGSEEGKTEMHAELTQKFN